MLNFAPVYCYCAMLQWPQKSNAGTALHWIPEERKQRGWLWLTWRDTVWRDIECMDMKWEDVCLMGCGNGQRRL